MQIEVAKRHLDTAAVVNRLAADKFGTNCITGEGSYALVDNRRGGTGSGRNSGSRGSFNGISNRRAGSFNGRGSITSRG